jgi:hypothetical protein
MSDKRLFIHVNKIKSKNVLGQACVHNTRKEGDKTGAHIDKERTSDNEYLAGTQNDNFVTAFQNKIAESEYYNTHDIRSNAVIALEAISNYPGELKINESGWEIKDREKFEKWKTETVDFLKHKFGEENVINIALHMDESTPHIHAVIIPMHKNERGEKKLNYSHYVDGKSSLKALQTEYADALADTGFERGVKDSPTKVQTMKKMRADSVRFYEKELPPVKKGQSAADYRKEINELYKGASVKAGISENKLKEMKSWKDLAAKKDKTIDNQRTQINALQSKNQKLEEELMEMKRRKVYEKYGIDTHPQSEDVQKLYVPLQEDLIRRGQEYVEAHNINVDRIADR